MDNFLKNSSAGSMACFIATGTLNPLEVIKIQIQTNSVYNQKGLITTAFKLYEIEGFWYGLMQPGLAASCTRELFYSSIRFAIYPDLRNFFRTDSHHLGLMALGEKFGAGLIAGAIGSSVANPADLLKIRMQAEPGKIDSNGIFSRGPNKGVKRRYLNTFEAFKSIWNQGRFKGLYRGVSATCIRSSLLTAGQLSSYDHSKQIFKASGYFKEGIPLHVTSSVISGLVAATFCAPADRVKTLMMTGNTKLNFIQAFVQIIKSDGLIGLYRGWTPSYFRLAPHFIISLPLNEQFRRLLGLQAF